MIEEEGIGDGSISKCIEDDEDEDEDEENSIPTVPAVSRSAMRRAETVNQL